MRTPIDRFHALVDIAVLGHFAENADLRHFNMFLQCKVGVIPIPEHTETDKIRFLFRYARKSVIMTPFA